MGLCFSRSHRQQRRSETHAEPVPGAKLTLLESSAELGGSAGSPSISCNNVGNGYISMVSDISRTSCIDSVEDVLEWQQPIPHFMCSHNSTRRSNSFKRSPYGANLSATSATQNEENAVDTDNGPRSKMRKKPEHEVSKLPPRQGLRDTVRSPARVPTTKDATRRPRTKSVGKLDKNINPDPRLPYFPIRQNAAISPDAAAAEAEADLDSLAVLVSDSEMDDDATILQTSFRERRTTAEEFQIDKDVVSSYKISAANAAARDRNAFERQNSFKSSSPARCSPTNSGRMVIKDTSLDILTTTKSSSGGSSPAVDPAPHVNSGKASDSQKAHDTSFKGTTRTKGISVRKQRGVHAVEAQMEAKYVMPGEPKALTAMTAARDRDVSKLDISTWNSSRGFSPLHCSPPCTSHDAREPSPSIILTNARRDSPSRSRGGRRPSADINLNADMEKEYKNPLASKRFSKSSRETTNSGQLGRRHGKIHALEARVTSRETAHTQREDKTLPAARDPAVMMNATRDSTHRPKGTSSPAPNVERHTEKASRNSMASKNLFRSPRRFKGPGGEYQEIHAVESEVMSNVSSRYSLLDKDTDETRPFGSKKILGDYRHEVRSSVPTRSDGQISDLQHQATTNTLGEILLRKQSLNVTTVEDVDNTLEHCCSQSPHSRTSGQGGFDNCNTATPPRSDSRSGERNGEFGQELPPRNPQDKLWFRSGSNPPTPPRQSLSEDSYRKTRDIKDTQSTMNGTYTSPNSEYGSSPGFMMNSTNSKPDMQWIPHITTLTFLHQQLNMRGNILGQDEINNWFYKPNSTLV